MLYQLFVRTVQLRAPQTLQCSRNELVVTRHLVKPRSFSNFSRGGRPTNFVRTGRPSLGKPLNEAPKGLINNLWHDLKAKYPGCLLLIQIGDFYEILNEDAKEASEILDIVLTKRRVSKNDNAVDMAGIPVRTLQKHLPKLTKAGKKVAIINQVTDEAKRTIQREVVRIVTAGTLYEDEMLQPGENNYLASIVCANWSDTSADSIGLAWTDISTGELFAQSSSLDTLKEDLERIDPKELLLSDDVVRQNPSTLAWLFPWVGTRLTPLENRYYNAENNWGGKGQSAVNFAKKSMSVVETKAVLGLIHYVDSTLMPNFDWTSPKYLAKSMLTMDRQTRLALDVVQSQSVSGGTLLKEIDYTVTAGGARLLRKRLEMPLVDVDDINQRLDSVEYFIGYEELTTLRRLLRTIRDPARALQRLRVGRWTIKDLVDVFHAIDVGRIIADEAILNTGSTELELCSKSLSGLANIEENDLQRDGLDLARKALRLSKSVSRKNEPVFAQGHPKPINCIADLHNELSNALFPSKHYYSFLNSKAEEDILDYEDDESDDELEQAELATSDEDDAKPSLGSKQLFQATYSPLYDHLFKEAHGFGSVRVQELQREYQETYDRRIKIIQSGTPGKRQGSTSPFMVEVPKSVTLDPAVFSPVQHLKHRTRYTTDELVTLSYESLHSKELLNQVERILGDYLTGNILAFAHQLDEFFDSLARVDVACSSAQAAMERRLERPIIDAGPSIHVLDGRHLTVERGNVNFVRNDLVIHAEGEPSLWLITGPNMGGKSTFLRSSAAIVILAQAGCFVPALTTQVGIVDRIFARIGASDDISNNRSTFLVEMQETAQFLNQATPKSLVIVDELGRGTSPEEGYAIAQATMEELVKIGCRTLFATHFHALAGDLGGPCAALPDRIGRYTTEIVSYKDEKQIIPTFRVIKGVATSSYGLNAARLAGVPQHVLDRAEELLKQRSK